MITDSMCFYCIGDIGDAMFVLFCGCIDKGEATL